MASTSNDNGRVFEYCLTKYIIENSLNKIEIDDTTKKQQERDILKCSNTRPELIDFFMRASKQYFELLPKNIVSLKRLSDNEGIKGDPTDIQIVYIENNITNIKNISLKNNHNAVKHQRPGSLISQLGILDKNEDQLYKENINSLEKKFISNVESLGFNTDNELLFSDVKSYSEQVILELYDNFCSLTASIINKFCYVHASDYFHFLVSRTDFEKIIIHYPNKIIIQEWSKLRTPSSMTAFVSDNSYVNVKFNNGYSFKMRLHTASSRFKKGTSISLKFDTRLEKTNDVEIPTIEFSI